MYLNASISQRMALLRGLMDSDGTCSRRDGACIFVNKNRRLVDQVKRLAASLGFKPSMIYDYAASIGDKDCGRQYRVSFTAYAGEESPFFLPRKTANLKPRGKWTRQTRKIAAVNPVASRPVRCIMVDSPSHLYLVSESFIPTHNTSLEIAFMIYLILYFREMGIDISMDFVRATAALAEDVLYELKVSLETNATILELWGNLKHVARVWAQKSINLSKGRDATVSASGADYGGAGKHPDIVFFDDLVNEKNYLSTKAKRQAKVKIQAYYPILPPWGSMLVTGTRFAHNDVYGWLLDQNEKDAREHRELLRIGDHEGAAKVKPQWHEYIRSIRDRGGNLFFPARLSEKFLAQQKRSIEAKMYAAWYENRPDVEGMVRFRLDYLQYFSARFRYEPIPMLEVLGDMNGKSFPIAEFPVTTYMTIDPTVTANRTSDWTGMTVNAVDADDHWWLLVARRYLEVPSKIGESALDLIRRYRPARCRIESANADIDMVARIQRGISDEGLPTVLESYHPVRDEVQATGRRKKTARIEALEPRFRNGGISIHRNTCEALYDQYKGWPDVENDDVFDALGMQYGLAKPCRFRSIDDARAEGLNAEDTEETGQLFGSTFKHSLRRADGSIRVIHVPLPERGDEDAFVVGRAGVSSQRLKR
jgi:hypothetical protein